MINWQQITVCLNTYLYTPGLSNANLTAQQNGEQEVEQSKTQVKWWVYLTGWWKAEQAGGDVTQEQGM